MHTSDGAGASVMGEPQGLITVSAEMITLMGPSPSTIPTPAGPVALLVTLEAQDRSLHLDPRPNLRSLLPKLASGQTLFLIQREALVRIGGGDLLDEGKTQFHLTSELAQIVLALREAEPGEAARLPYRMAKSVEFVCQTIREFNRGALAPISAAGQLSSADTRRVLAARQFIYDRASEKLTLNIIGRHCGLSRSKLTRGFKELFDRTVAQDIAARRLELARQMLLTTDLPIALVGLEAGYLNNASFSRAFGRRFGRAPSLFRSAELAA